LSVYGRNNEPGSHTLAQIHTDTDTNTHTQTLADTLGQTKGLWKASMVYGPKLKYVLSVTINVDGSQDTRKFSASTRYQWTVDMFLWVSQVGCISA